MREFIKKYRWRLLLSSLIVLLPMVFGLLMWNELPASMATHWGADGTADGFGARGFAVVVMPLMLLAVHWVCILLTAADRRNREQGPKATGLVFMIIPFVSLVVGVTTYCVALGYHKGPELFVPIMMALLFIVFGNALPKIKQNNRLGIKLHWTLANEDNWNATHRFSGKVWVAGGFVVLIAMLLPGNFFIAVLVADLTVLAAAPVIYSYCYYRRQKAAGVYYSTLPPLEGSRKAAGIASAIIVVIIFAGVAVLMFTGNIDFRIGDDSLYIEADYYADLSVSYANIESIELVESFEGGLRTNGYGSPRLAMGTFRNEEFGYYTRYTYTKQSCAVILRRANDVLLINCAEEADTRALYEALLAKLA